MRMELGELRRQARGAMAAARPSVWLVTLIWLLLTEGLSMVLDLSTGDMWGQMTLLLQQGLEPRLALPLALERIGPTVLFFHILLLLFTAVMQYGYRSWALKTARGEGRLGDLADGFALALRAILLRLLMAAYTLIWGMVFSVPVVILATMTRSRLAAAAVAAAGTCFCVVYLMRYQLAPYCMMDDERHRVLRALHQSVLLLRGRTPEFLLLLLSFLGWILIPTAVSTAAEAGLLVLTGGWEALRGAAQGAGVPAWIGTASALCAWPCAVWVTPYLAVSVGLYYDRLSPAERRDENEPEDPA